MSWLPKWLGGGEGELGRDDLLRGSATAIKKVARYGERGKLVLPPELVVRIEVGEGSLEIARQFIEGADFDRELGALLANELDCELDELPLRQFEIVPGARTRVTLREGAARVWQLTIEGGDRDGQTLRLPRGRSAITFGRGLFHGPEGSPRNDLVLCEATDFVSRRAGRFLLEGGRLEVESLGQGDRLAVRQSAGASIRPMRTTSGRAAVNDGDRIELDDGADERLRLILRRVASELDESAAESNR